MHRVERECWTVMGETDFGLRLYVTTSMRKIKERQQMVHFILMIMIRIIGTLHGN